MKTPIVVAAALLAAGFLGAQPATGPLHNGLVPPDPKVLSGETPVHTAGRRLRLAVEDRSTTATARVRWVLVSLARTAESLERSPRRDCVGEDMTTSESLAALAAMAPQQLGEAALAAGAPAGSRGFRDTSVPMLDIVGILTTEDSDPVLVEESKLAEELAKHERDVADWEAVLREPTLLATTEIEKLRLKLDRQHAVLESDLESAVSDIEEAAFDIKQAKNARGDVAELRDRLALAIGISPADADALYERARRQAAESGDSSDSGAGEDEEEDDGLDERIEQAALAHGLSGGELDAYIDAVENFVDAENDVEEGLKDRDDATRRAEAARAALRLNEEMAKQPRRDVKPGGEDGVRELAKRELAATRQHAGQARGALAAWRPKADAARRYWIAREKALPGTDSAEVREALPVFRDIGRFIGRWPRLLAAEKKRTDAMNRLHRSPASGEIPAR